MRKEREQGGLKGLVKETGLWPADNRYEMRKSGSGGCRKQIPSAAGRKAHVRGTGRRAMYKAVNIVQMLCA